MRSLWNKRTPHAGWQEVYEGGSAEAEQKIFAKLAADISGVQKKIAGKVHQPAARTFHAKLIAGVTNARLEVDADLASDLRVGYFVPGAAYRASVRLSNASPIRKSDASADMRGIAIKVHLSSSDTHDLLMTSFKASHARNARQFVRIAQIVTGPKALVLPRLILALGLSETKRVLANFKSAASVCASMALQPFWSRAPLLWGEAGPVRYLVRPMATGGTRTHDGGPDFLSKEMSERLREGDVAYRLAVQRFVEEKRRRSRMVQRNGGKPTRRRSTSPHSYFRTKT